MGLKQKIEIISKALCENCVPFCENTVPDIEPDEEDKED